MILSIKPGIIMTRLQMIKTKDDKDFRFGRVFLVKRHWLGKKMIALDATDEEGEFKEIVEMKIFIEEDGQYHEVDVNNILCWSLKKGRFFFGAKESEA